MSREINPKPLFSLSLQLNDKTTSLSHFYFHPMDNFLIFLLQLKLIAYFWLISYLI